MTFHLVLAKIAVIVLGMVCVAAVVVIGPRRLRETRARGRERLRRIGPFVVILGVVLIINRIGRRVGPELSWIIGWNVTGKIYAIEGTIVADVQSFAVPSVTTYFSFAYLHGYVFLLVFPLIAYFALENIEPLQETILAYTFNYGIGLLCYILFIAYGPRNLMPELVESLLYTNWPEAKFLTSQVNVNSNVFPSLHASLSLTVAALAYRTRDVYPRWWYLSWVLAASVVISTMYLGIHWALDVVAGGVLALVSVYAATRSLGFHTDQRRDGPRWVPGYVDRVRDAVHRWVEVIR